jgi:hypothetical protein
MEEKGNPAQEWSQAVSRGGREPALTFL